MIITEVTAKDFLSFGSISTQIPKSGLMLVTGWDEDLGRANGAGKSSLFQAIAWCIYGELPREIKVEELIRRGQNSCSVTVKLEIDGVPYTITRKRPSGLDLAIGAEKQKGNPKYIQALIEQLVGLSYEQFLITSYFPQKGDASRFLKQNDTKAKDFLGTILNFNKTETAYKKLHLELKEISELVATKRGEVSSAEAAIERFRTIGSMPIPPMPTKEEVLQVKASMQEVDLITKNPPNTADIDQQIARVQEALDKVRSAKYTIPTLERTIVEKSRRIEHLERSEAHTLVCPSCAADLLESEGKLVTFDADTALEVRQSKIEAVNAEVAQLKEQIANLSPLLAKEAQGSAKLDKLKQDRLQARHEYDMAIQKKSHLTSQMNGFKSAITACQQAKLQQEKIAEQLAEMQSSLAGKLVELKKLEAELMVVAAAKSVMSPTGAIAYSLDGVMSDLNSEVGQYLDIFSHNTMSYRISSGDDKAKVTHHVSKDSSDVSVGSLSGGEERGLILSVDLGLSEVIAARSGVNLPSILMLDECFEGLDYVGKEKVIDALREIAKDRCIIVIDHSTEFNALFDTSIKVVKKDQISRLEVS